MAEKKQKTHRIRNFLNMLMIIPTVFNFFGGLFSLIEHEASLAKRTLIDIIIMCALLGVVFLAGWLCVLGMLFLYLVSLQLSYLASLGIVFLINFILLIILVFKIIAAKRQLFFPTTRAMIRNVLHK